MDGVFLIGRVKVTKLARGQAEKGSTVENTKRFA
jgi:hypothetical protein